MQKKEKSEQLRDNIRYLIKSRGETQLSLCISSGLTRSTIYKILDGRVTNVQQSTIRKISDFFGVSCHEIETTDFRETETRINSTSIYGNINPSAIPIIKQRMLEKTRNRNIGELCTTHPLTYYFGPACDVIAVLIESEIEGFNEPGDLLIVKRGAPVGAVDLLSYDNQSNRLQVILARENGQDCMTVVGEIIEERLNVN